jgi:hypothetical protein
MLRGPLTMADTLPKESSQEESPQVQKLDDNKNRPRTQITSPITTALPLTNPQGVNISHAVKGKYGSDELSKVIIDKPKEHKNFMWKDDLLYIKLENREALCIPGISVDNRRLRELLISEAHTLLAHLGPQKTLLYLRDHVWWKSMVKETTAFCESCITCKSSKPSNQKPFGLLNPLRTPQHPWESIGIDFVGPLPSSQNRNGYYDTITTLTD